MQSFIDKASKSYSRVFFSELDNSFFYNCNPDDFHSNSSLFLENLKDLTNGFLKIKLKCLEQNQEAKIYIARLKDKVYLDASLSKTIIILNSGFHGFWKVEARFNSIFQSGKILQAGAEDNPVKVFIESFGIVSIGNNCLLSTGVTIQCGDSHSIIDLKKKKILNNKRALIMIGNYFWGSRNSNLICSSKEMNIGSGSILGLASTLTKSIPKNCIYAGAPAKLIRENVSWTWSRTPSENDIENVIKYLDLTS